VLRAERPIVEDVGEDEQTAITLGGELEAKQFVAPDPGEQPRRRQLGYLASLATSFEDLAQFGPPMDWSDEPARELGRRADSSTDPIDRVVEAAFDAQGGTTVDGFQAGIHHGFSFRCRSSASRRSDQWAR